MKQRHVHLIGDSTALPGLHEVFVAGQFCDCVVVVRSGGSAEETASFKAHRSARQFTTAVTALTFSHVLQIVGSFCRQRQRS